MAHPASMPAAKAHTSARRAFVREFYRENKGMMTLALLAAVGAALLDLALSRLMQQLIDVAMGSDQSALTRLVPYLIGLTVSYMLVFALDALALPRFLRRASRQYKGYAFRRITRKSISSFSSESSARYISALTNDVTVIETSWLTSIFSAAQMLLAAIGALALMIWYSPLLTAWVIGLVLLPLVISILTGGLVVKAEKRVSEDNEGFVAMVKDMLTGFPVVKSFRAEEQIGRLFETRNARLEESKCRRETLKKAVNGVAGIASVVAQFGVFGIGAWLAVTGRGVTPGMTIAFVQMMNYLLGPIHTLPGLVAGYRSSMGLVDKLAEAVEENNCREGKAINGALHDAIRLEHVSFGYEPGKPVLRDVTFAFEAGKRYAIVGGSGSGKSTLLNLLMGGYDRYEGSLTVDGEEVRGVASDSLYEMMSIVQQNVFLFDDTIRENITMFRDFPEEAVRSAILCSGLDAVVQEKGLDFRCGENGSGLSGGERQRVSIARCLLRRAPVMLMDEATAALDNQTARDIIQAVLDLRGVTRIVVTHWLEAPLLRQYDNILVLRGGAVCESGTFDELMARNGYFRSLYTVSQDPVA